MLCFRRSVVSDSCLCGLQDLFEFAKERHAGEPWPRQPSLAAGRYVQHPERHFQDPTSRDAFQAAICYRLTPFDAIGMHLHSPAMPWMPAVDDFTEISNMGVALLSCSIGGELTCRLAKTHRNPEEYSSALCPI